MKILVTGAGGFLGRRVAQMLLERGRRVRVMVRRPVPDLAALGAEVFFGDLLDQAASEAAVSGQDGLVHCAAKSGVWGDPDEFLAVNMEATMNLAQAARRAGLGWMVHTSSPSVVHDAAPLAGADESVPTGVSAKYMYPHTKLMAEMFVMWLWSQSDGAFRTVALRPHLIWGPGDPHFLPRLTARARAGRLFLFKSNPLVDSTYIDNAAWAHVLAVEKIAGPDGDKIAGQVYFISQGEPLPVKTLVEKLIQAVDPALRVRALLPDSLGRVAAGAAELLWRHLPLSGEPPLTRFVWEELTRPHWFDISRARADLGYAPLCSIDEALSKLAEAAGKTPSASSPEA